MRLHPRPIHPAYFRDACVSVVSVAARSRLRPADREDMIDVPHVRSVLCGPLSFRVFVP